MFGCQAVVDGEHRYAAVGDVAGHRPVIDGNAAADHPASVQVQHRWPEGRAVLGVPAQQDVAAIDSGGMEVRCLHVGGHGLRRGGLGHDGFEHRASRLHVADGRRRDVGHRRDHRCEGGCNFGVERERQFGTP
jgi:myo-inositol-hexaphosphate 3-phosphohydrolase